MLKNIKKIKKFYKENQKLIYFGLFFLIIILILLFSPAKINNKKVKHNVSSLEIINLFNKINNNYSLTIEENINGELKILEYSNDSKVILYEGSKANDNGYLLYNNNLYIVNQKNNKLSREKNIPNFVNDRLYDLNLLKKVIPHCELEYVNEVKANCKMNLSSYISEYNSLYNENISVLEDEKINFEIIHYSDRIGKINIDYTPINKLINNNEDNVFYGIKIYNIDSNDFSDILEYYKDTLK